MMNNEGSHSELLFSMILFIEKKKTFFGQQAINIYSKCFVSILLLIILQACHQNKAGKVQMKEVGKATTAIQPALWMLGSWKSTSRQGVTIEDWNIADDSTLKGMSYFIKDKDTIVLERVLLQARHSKMYYEPVVSHQNNGKPVSFLCIESTPSRLVFENKNHDFPQKIIYNAITNDSAWAEISGPQNGKTVAMRFTMKRR